MWRIELRRVLSALLTAVGLGAPPAAAGVAVQDDTGATVGLARPAQRIVSLAPHLTELLFAAGAGARVVGVGAYSDYPEAARALPQVGDSAMLDLERIVALKPDLLVVWRDGNSPQQLQRLAVLGIPVYSSELATLADIGATLRALRPAGRHRGGGAGTCRGAWARCARARCRSWWPPMWRRAASTCPASPTSSTMACR